MGNFGFTGELQQGSNVYLRARWYNTSASTFTARDPFTGYAQAPYSQHYYAYGYSNPVLLTDPSGRDPWWNEDVDARPCPAGQVRDVDGQCVYNKQGPQGGFPDDTVSGGKAAPPDLTDPLIFTPPIYNPPPEGVDPPPVHPGILIFTDDDWPFGPLVTDPPLDLSDIAIYEDCRELFAELFPGYLTNDDLEYIPPSGPFPNRAPHRLANELAIAKKVGVPILTVHAPSPEFDKIINHGTIKWAVNMAGELVVMPHQWRVEIYHPVLVNGEPVQAAGEADIAGNMGNYIGLSITNFSGHYQPSYQSLKKGIEAFEKIGVTFPPP